MCALTDTVFFPMSEVSTGTDSLVKLKYDIWFINKKSLIISKRTFKKVAQKEGKKKKKKEAEKQLTFYPPVACYKPIIRH